MASNSLKDHVSDQTILSMWRLTLQWSTSTLTQGKMAINQSYQGYHVYNYKWQQHLKENSKSNKRKAQEVIHSW